MDLQIFSEFYEENAPEIRIKDYYLLKYADTQLLIKIDFENPYQLSRSFLEPDTLILKFEDQVKSI